MRENFSDERDVLRDFLVLIDAEVLAQLRADVLAELPLVGVGDLDFGDLLVDLGLGVLRVLEGLAEAAELRARGHRATEEAHERQRNQ